MTSGSDTKTKRTTIIKKVIRKKKVSFLSCLIYLFK